ncbi:hypothetical protein SAMN05421678_102382 [Actinopolymorpha cephalotaxi]|uniref:Nephrocystin 3-like N-terminal domain-containing protein n=1 Tax=Actinopolymorpha cephalotaxi TaxID=504797 RepID=A0A1I2M1H5_9ACTN|nr:hypothetical protein SAMN05421678_102382 [Actinopolymorpha cephalotaxi]
MARDAGSEDHFRSEVRRVGRLNRTARERLQQIDKVVALAAVTEGIDTQRLPNSELTWRLLTSLTLREIRLEGIDESDRSFCVARLRGIVSAGTAAAADRLFSRLSELAGRYAPNAAAKNMESLRRDLVGYSLVGGSSSDDQETATEQRPTRILARSAYLSQVRRIAPQQLRARETDLAELTRFCTSLESSSYLWLRAEAWAGKSALLSSFALNPPQGVRVVSFFITARWAGQADRTAFIEVVHEQLLELLGEPMPVLLTGATREAHLLDAFERAANLCRRREERLILVVDGLDEDSGVTTSPDAHSIAAVLPENPPAGMRVIVAGRPNPPIPTDVPDSHPLRKADIVRSLRRSEYATVVRQDAERELKRLLRGSAIEKDLLGLLTAAGGGLSEGDLAQLTDAPAWEIQDHLQAVSARTFNSRAGRWQAEVPVYVLGHEEIYQQALRFLGETRLEEYRERIHEWVEGYRAAKWPPNTPEYPLRGYFRLLQATADTPRMLKCVTDPDRHNRMLDIIGGDSAALSEIFATQEQLLSTTSPDLVALGRVAVHRIRLTERNDHLPVNLPVVWAQVGRYSRAEALARSITTPIRQVRALVSVAQELNALGELDRARAVAEQAEQGLRAITSTDSEEQAHANAAVARAYAKIGDIPHAQALIGRALTAAKALDNGPQRADAFRAVTRAVAATGNIGEALALAGEINRSPERAGAVSAVALEIAESGNWKRGYSISRSIRPRADRAHTLATIAKAASISGARRRADSIAAEAQSLAFSIQNPGRRAWILAAVAREVRSIYGPEAAWQILREAESAALVTPKASERTDALTSIAGVLALCGVPDRAAELVRDIPSLRRRARALAVLASNVAMAGEKHTAEQIANEAEAISRSLDGGSRVAVGQAALAQATAAVGDIEQAVHLAHSISDVPRRDRALTTTAEAVARAGNLDRALEVAKSVSDVTQQSVALFLVAKVAIGVGDIEQVKRISGLIEDPAYKTKAFYLPSRVNSGRSGGNTQPAQTVRVTDSDDDATSADEPIAPPTDSSLTPFELSERLVGRALILVHDRNIEQAAKVVESISVPVLRVRALATLSRASASNGDVDAARELVDRALVMVDMTPQGSYRDSALNEVLHQLVAIGESERAERLAATISNPVLRHRALSTIASAIALSGNILSAEGTARRISDGQLRAKTLASIVEVAVSSGEMTDAERIVFSIAAPASRARALGVVTQGWASKGNMQRSETVASEITDPIERSKTLSDLAVNYPSDRSHHLLAQALVIGHWSTCLRALARIRPDLITVIGAEFLHANGPGGSV